MLVRRINRTLGRAVMVLFAVLLFDIPSLSCTRSSQDSRTAKQGAPAPASPVNAAEAVVFPADWPIKGFVCPVDAKRYPILPEYWKDQTKVEYTGTTMMQGQLVTFVGFASDRPRKQIVDFFDHQLTDQGFVNAFPSDQSKSSIVGVWDDEKRSLALTLMHSRESGPAALPVYDGYMLGLVHIPPKQ